MRLLSLTTSNYRNLAGEKIEFSPGINLLYGKNAAGKTNTLECAYVFASGKSFRARQESELIRRGEQTARADASVERGGYTEEMSVIWHKSKEQGFIKRMLYRGFEVPKVSEFLGVFRAVLFTPDHLSLIKGSPEERRRFMDIALSQLQPRYVYCMNSYLKILAQKNAYLKNAQISGKVDNDYLDILNSQLAGAAAIVIKQRSGFAELLKEYASELYGNITDSKECLDVRYISVAKQNLSDTEETEKKLFEIYLSDRASEIKQGKTLHGPHRDDMMIYISGNVNPDEQTLDDENAVSELAARTFGSQGQQRSAVLAIKLAEGEIFNNITGEYPVFLLDDLLGELDCDRREKLFGLIRDKQAIISCCDKGAIPNMSDITAFEVSSGRYSKDEQ